MTKHALVVAISNYKNPANNLAGVANDIPAIEEVLSSQKVTNVTRLFDHEATSQAIKDSLNRLAKQSKRGDVLVFYFSGHGIQLPAELSSADKDGKDEALVPWECDLSSLILDNWIAQFVRYALPPEVRYWGLYDCCNSGDLADVAKRVQSNALLDPHYRVKRLNVADLYIDSMPSPVSRPQSAVTELKKLILNGGPKNNFHYGAAEPDKSALCMTIAGKPRSVFTWALEKVLNGTPQMGNAVEAATRAKMREVTTEHEAWFSCPEGSEGDEFLS